MVAVVQQRHRTTRTQTVGVVRIILVENRPLTVSVQSDNSLAPVGEPQRLVLILDDREPRVGWSVTKCISALNVRVWVKRCQPAFLLAGNRDPEDACVVLD